jgi:hypothetical protein
MTFDKFSLQLSLAFGMRKQLLTMNRQTIFPSISNTGQQSCVKSE